jgi:hypothetical protein
MTLRFKWDRSKFSGTVQVYFEAAMYSLVGSYTSYAQLYDNTAGSAVTNSEVTTSGTFPVYLCRSGDISSYLTSGNEYTAQIKTDSGGQISISGAKLIIVQSQTGGINRTESYQQLIVQGATAGYTGSFYSQTYHYNYFDPGNWSPLPPHCYHEATMKVSSVSYTGYAELQQQGVSTLDERTTSSTAYTRLRRSSTITMPTSAADLEARTKTTGGTLYVAGTRLIVQWSAHGIIDEDFTNDNYVFNSTNQRKVVRDSTGNWYVVYVKYNGSTTKYEVKLAKSSDCGYGQGTCSWTVVTLYGSGGIVNNSTSNHYISPSIDVNSNRDQIHLVVFDSTNNTVRYSKCTSLPNWNSSSYWFQANGTTNGDEQIASSVAGDSQALPVVAVDSSNVAHVVFEQMENCSSVNYNQIRYNNSTNWSSITSVTNTRSCTVPMKRVKPTIDIGNSGLVHILYMDYINSSYTAPKYFMYANSSDAFSVKTAVISETSNYNSSGPSIAALDGENKIWVAGFLNYSGTYRTRFNYYNGSSWSGGTGGTNISTTGYYVYPMVGTDPGSTNTSHRFMVENYSSSYGILSSTWDGSAFPAPSSITGVSGDNYTDSEMVSLEKQKLGNSDVMGYAWYKSSDNTLYFNTFSGFTPTAVDLASFTAKTDGENIALEWKTGYEVNNLGFHIYREENGESFRVTPELVAGSAFLTGTGIPLTAGRSYVWIDASNAEGPSRTAGLEDRPFGTRGAAPKGGLEAVASNLKPQATLQAERSLSHAEGMTVAYWLEDWDLNGKKTLHGPVTPVYSNKPLLKYGNAALLSDLGKRQNQKYEDFWRIQEIRERLLKDRPAERGKRTIPLSAGFEDHPREAGLRGAAPKRGLEAVASNLKPQATSETERSSSVSGSAQRALASQPGIKIGIREQGWYRVTQPELIAAGLDPWVDPRRLQLFVDGKEQSILVRGEADGRFDAADSVEFYGTGQDTPFSDTRVYWLIEGTRLGRRIKTKQSRSGIPGIQNFPHTLEIKETNIYIAALKNGDEENFFGAVVSSESVDHILNITNLDTLSPGDALLEVALQGGTSPSHQVKVFVNDSEVTEIQFEGMVRKVMSVGLPHSLLLEGENLVSLVAQGGEADVSVVDFIRLTYRHTYTAEQDSLEFPVSSGREVAVNGFTTPDIRVADITNPRRVREVTGGVVETERLGYTVRFGLAGSGKRVLLAFAEAAVKSPASIVANEPSSWSMANHSADIVIITHQGFIESLGPLKNLRESQGWSVALIDVQDIYDEFSFGAKNPWAVREFLHKTQTSWQGPPRFVLLVGDASFDPRNYLGLGDVDFVPTKLIDTVYLETASDDWFVDFNNDGLPSIPIGRIPVRTAEEAALVVFKIIAYEAAAPGTWAQQAAMIADKMEEEDSFDFARASAEVETLLPENVTAEQIFRSDGDDGTTRTRIIDSINAGKLLVNYVGHGSVEFWRGGIFSSDDVATLTNGTRLPFFIIMNCLNGYFHDPFPTDSLAESLLRVEGGGAIAVWASSGLTEPEGQSLMNKELIPLLFDGTLRTLGEATAKAKSATRDTDVRKTWILFGDPATRLKP